MVKKRKTRSEKVASTYRLRSVLIKTTERRKKRDIEEFAYLSSSYVKKDLLKTVGFSVLIIIVELYLSTVL